VTAALYWWRATRAQTWRSTVLVIVICAVLGTVSLGALAGARRTESAYGRYLRASNASDVYVNIPAPGTSLIAQVSGLPGITSAAAWLGLNANPVVHGRVDDAFETDGMAGSLNGEFFRQDDMTLVAGRLPPLRSTNEIVLTPRLAQSLDVRVGDKLTYQYEDSQSFTSAVTGYSTYTVVGLVELPPALVDQFDQVQTAILPPGATAAALRHRNSVAFSWVDMRLTRGAAGAPALQTSLARLAASLHHPGLSFAIRRLSTVHQQVQEAIRPQAVALAIFGALAALALFVLAGQGLAQLLDRSATQLRILRAMGMTRAKTALATGLAGALAVVSGIVLAIGGALAVSPLAPVGPVRALDPARGFQFDTTVLLGGGLLLALLLVALGAGLAWRAARPFEHPNQFRSSVLARAALNAGLPTAMTLGASYALDPPPGRRRGPVRANLFGSVAAVTAVVTAVLFGASLSGVISHPVRYGWNWDALIQAQGGYGNFVGTNLTRLVDDQPGVTGWSTFGFAQLPIGGQSVPVLGLATHRGSVEPPTVTGHALGGTDQIEFGESTLHQLGLRVGDAVRVGSGPDARALRIVGTVTLPSLGVQLTDHVSLGRGAMVDESTLLAIGGVNAATLKEDVSVPELPSTLVIDVAPGTPVGPVVRRIVAADPGGVPGGDYQVHRVLGAAIANDAQMGSQPVTLAVVLAAAVVLSLAATVLASARQRRRDLAILRALSLTRRQIRAVIAWQTSTILLLAAVFGLPLGIAAGHWAWGSFAASIGVLPVTVVPWGPLLIGLLAVLVAGVALTATPAMLAARGSTTVDLRSE
jgi:hypothetical protein